MEPAARNNAKSRKAMNEPAGKAMNEPSSGIKHLIINQIKIRIKTLIQLIGVMHCFQYMLLF